MTTGAAPRRARRRSRARTFVPLGSRRLAGAGDLAADRGRRGGGRADRARCCCVAGFVLGAVVIKRAGRRALRNLTETLSRQQQASRAAGQPRGATRTAQRGQRPADARRSADHAARAWSPTSPGCCCLFPPVRGADAAHARERYLERRMRARARHLGDAFQQAAQMRSTAPTARSSRARSSGTTSRPDTDPGSGRRAADRAESRRCTSARTDTAAPRAGDHTEVVTGPRA